jgi:UDP-4-amino-4,6-dideoxy-N-acetyl-beta-L-altrosamine N-acetyltransferase
MTKTLRPLQKTDLPKMIEWRNNPKIMAWCRQETVLSWERHVAWYDSLHSRTDVLMFAIQDQGMIVGVCGLTSIDRLHQRAEFSLYIGPEYQRKGYARFGLLTLLKVGFWQLNLRLIWGETFDGNPAAHLFEQLGMVKEGTRRQFYFKSGSWIDAHLYSITREEFECSPRCR